MVIQPLSGIWGPLYTPHNRLQEDLFLLGVTSRTLRLVPLIVFAYTQPSPLPRQEKSKGGVVTNFTLTPRHLLAIRESLSCRLSTAAFLYRAGH